MREYGVMIVNFNHKEEVERKYFGSEIREKEKARKLFPENEFPLYVGNISFSISTNFGASFWGIIFPILLFY